MMQTRQLVNDSAQLAMASAVLCLAALAAGGAWLQGWVHHVLPWGLGIAGGALLAASLVVLLVAGWGIVMATADPETDP